MKWRVCRYGDVWAFIGPTGYATLAPSWESAFAQAFDAAAAAQHEVP